MLLLLVSERKAAHHFDPVYELLPRCGAGRLSHQGWARWWIR